MIRDTIYLHNLHIEVTKGWETQLLEDLSLHLSRKVGLTADQKNDALKIAERKLIIQVHNTWNDIDEQICTLRYNKSGTELEASSIIKLDSVLVDPYIAIVFILEYQLRIKGGKTSNDSINVS